ncbi:hypothetical protein BJX68DRAFT_246875 [Aspergillus pseudodeflectus]|uniref:Uncharacterized protein n=1 Tax=Aspergillus pseudodeflectus TaxID=176178 RepID=A0ABR4JKZ9_9EURO
MNLEAVPLSRLRRIDCIFVYYFLDLRVVRTTYLIVILAVLGAYLLRTAQPPHAPSLNFQSRCFW